MNEYDLMGHLSPEAIDQLFGLGQLGDENEILAQEIQQAIALRNKPHQNHITGLGAALGGLGDIGNTITSDLQEGKYRKQQQENLDKQTKARQAYGMALLRANQQPQPYSVPPTQQPQSQYSVPPYLQRPTDQGQDATASQQFIPFSYGGY